MTRLAKPVPDSQKMFNDHVDRFAALGKRACRQDRGNDIVGIDRLELCDVAFVHREVSVVGCVAAPMIEQAGPGLFPGPANAGKPANRAAAGLAR